MIASNFEHYFCRLSYSEVMREVRKKFTPEQVKAAWVYNTGTRTKPAYEFHGPDNHYDYNLKMADCSYGAAAEGWRRLLDKDEREAV